MKKLLSLLCAFLMMFTFSSCQKDNNLSSGESSSESSLSIERSNQEEESSSESAKKLVEHQMSANLNDLTLISFNGKDNNGTLVFMANDTIYDLHLLIYPRIPKDGQFIEIEDHPVHYYINRIEEDTLVTFHFAFYENDSIKGTSINSVSISLHCGYKVKYYYE